MFPFLLFACMLQLMHQVLNGIRNKKLCFFHLIELKGQESNPKAKRRNLITLPLGVTSTPQICNIRLLKHFERLKLLLSQFF